MTVKHSSKLIKTLLVLVIILSAFAPITYAANKENTTPIITEYTENTFIRSDGSVWVLSGQQLIPTQVAGITNAVKVLANGFVQTEDGKTYALQVENQITKPFLLETDAKVVKVRDQYLIDESGKVYQYYLYYGDNIHYTVEKFNAFPLPFQVQDMLVSYYSFDNLYLTVYLYLTTDGKLWIRDSVNRQLQQFGSNDVTFTTLYDRVMLDDQGTMWSLHINANKDVDYTLKPVQSTKSIQQISYSYGDVLAINEDQDALFYTDAGWAPFQTVNNKKVLQVAGTNSNYYYLTADHMLYYKSLNKSTLITNNVASFHLNQTTFKFLYQKQDGTLGTWPSSSVQKKDEKVNWDPNSTYFDLQPPIPVYVNNETIGMPKGAWLINNTTYLPLRSIFTQLGATVTWDHIKKVASLSTNSNGQANHITIDYSNQKLYLNNKLVPVDQELFIADGAAFLPLRVVSEGLGAKVNWNPNTKEIHITSD